MLSSKLIYQLQSCIQSIVAPTQLSTESIKQAQKTLQQLRQHQGYLSLLVQYLNKNEQNSRLMNHKQLVLLELRKATLHQFILDKYIWENIIHFYYQCDQCYDTTVLDLFASQIKIGLQCMDNCHQHNRKQIKQQGIFNQNSKLIDVLSYSMQLIFKIPDWGYSQTTKLLLLISLTIKLLLKPPSSPHKQLIVYLFGYFERVYPIITDEFGIYFQEWFFICVSQLHCSLREECRRQSLKFFQQVRLSFKEQERSLYMQIVVDLIENTNLQGVFENLPFVIRNLLKTFEKFHSKIRQQQRQEEICLGALRVLHHLVIPILQKQFKFAQLANEALNKQNKLIYELISSYSEHILAYEPQFIAFQEKPHANTKNISDFEEPLSLGPVQKYELINYLANTHCSSICYDIINNNHLQWISVLAYSSKCVSLPVAYQDKMIRLCIQSLGLLLHHNISISIELVTIILFFLSKNVGVLLTIQNDPTDIEEKQPILKLMYTLLQLPSNTKFSRSEHSKVIVNFMNSIIDYVVQTVSFDKVEQLYFYSLEAIKGNPMSLTVDSFYILLVLMSEVYEHTKEIEGEAQTWITFMELTEFFEEQPTNSLNFQMSFKMAEIAANMLMKPSCTPIDIALQKMTNYFVKNNLVSVETGIVHGYHLVKSDKYLEYLRSMMEEVKNFDLEQFDNMLFQISTVYAVFYFVPQVREQFQSKMLFIVSEFLKMHEKKDIQNIIKNLSHLHSLCACQNNLKLKNLIDEINDKVNY